MPSHEDLLPLAEPQDGSGPFLTALGEMAAQTGGMIVSGYAEAAEGILFNSAAASHPVWRGGELPQDPPL